MSAFGDTVRYPNGRATGCRKCQEWAPLIEAAGKVDRESMLIVKKEVHSLMDKMRSDSFEYEGLGNVMYLFDAIYDAKNLWRPGDIPPFPEPK